MNGSLPELDAVDSGVLPHLLVFGTESPPGTAFREGDAVRYEGRYFPDRTTGS